MSALRASLIRLRGLVGKEFLQILRDPSALMIAFLLPVVLLLINGFGISLDARDMRVAAVIDAPEESTRALLQALSNSPYLDVVRVNDTQEGAALMADGSVRFFTNGISPDVWVALGTRQGREAIGGF